MCKLLLFCFFLLKNIEEMLWTPKSDRGSITSFFMSARTPIGDSGNCCLIVPLHRRQLLLRPRQFQLKAGITSGPSRPMLHMRAGFLLYLGYPLPLKEWPILYNSAIRFQWANLDVLLPCRAGVTACLLFCANCTSEEANKINIYKNQENPSCSNIHNWEGWFSYELGCVTSSGIG